MSTTIDSRVVEMQFDNADFEKNVKTSLSTLKTLNSSLDGLNSANSLKGLEKAGNVDLSALEKSIDTVNSRFSTMGIIGMAALQTITDMAVRAGAKLVSALVSPIKDGGFNRALNLENAKFQLEGLLKSAEKVDEVMKDVDYGVKDTAYSLDAAAKVAAQLTASGIGAGEAMQKSLRGISGVASMTNSTYEEIGSIFTTVAGQGKLMTMQLRQLEARGLNAAAILGQQLGKSEAEIRDMVSKGQVNFRMFASAMDDAFGEHAKDANRTFTGALSNMKAALARTGAMFAGPYLTNMRDVFNAIRLSVNALNKELTPIADTAEKVMVRLKDLFVNSLLDPIEGGVRTEVVNIIRSLVTVFDNLNKVAGTVLSAIGTAFSSIFSGITATHVELFALSIENVSSKLLAFANKAAPHITMAFRGLFQAFDLIGKGIGLIVNAIKPFLPLASESIMFIIKLTGALGEYVTIIAQSIKTNETFVSIVNKLKEIVGPAFDFVSNGINKLVTAMREFSGLSDLNLPGINGLDNFAPLAIFDSILSKLKSFFNTLKGIATTVAPIIGSVFESLGNVFSNFAEGFSKLFASLKFDNTTFDLGGIAIVGTVLWAFAGTLKNVYGSISFIVERLGILFSDILPNKFVPLLRPLQLPNEFLKSIKNVFVTAKQAINEFTNQIKSEILIKIAAAIGILAASLLIISTIPAEKLASSLGAIGALMGELMIGFKYFEKLNGVTKGVGGLFGAFGDVTTFTTKIISFGAAILILAAALKTISTIDADKLGVSLAVLAGAMGAMAISLAFIGKYAQKIAVSSISMLAFAASISILAGALKKISGIKTDDLKSAGIALAAIMGGMVLSFIALDKFVWELPVTAAAMIAFALSVSILASAFKKLSKVEVSFDTFASFAGVIGGLVIGLSVLSKHSKELAITAGSMIAFSASMLILANAFKIIGSVENTSDAIFGFAAVVTGMVGSFVILNKIQGELPVTAGAMLAFSAAVLILSSAMKKIGSIENVGNAIGGFIVAVVGMVAAFGAMSKYVDKLPVTSSAMIAFSAAVLILAAAMKTIGSVTNVAAGFGGFALAVGAMVVSFAILSNHVTQLPAIGASMLAFSTAILILSVAMRTLASSSGDVITGGLVILVLTAGLVALAAVLPPLTPAILLFSGAVALLGVGFIALAVGIGMLSSLGATGLKVLFESVEEGIAVLPNLVFALEDVLVALLKVVGNLAQPLGEAVGSLIGGLIQGIANKTQSIISAGIDLVVNLMAGLAEGLPRLVDMGMKLAIAFLDSMSNALNTNTDALINAMERFIETLLMVALKAAAGFLQVGVNIISKILEGILKLGGNLLKYILGLFIECIGTVLGISPEAIEAGKAFINSIIDGIVQAFTDLIGVVKKVADFIIKGLKGLLGSKEVVEIGEDLDKNIAKGMENNADAVVDSAEKVGEGAADAMENAVNDGVDNVMSDLDTAADTVAAKVAKMRMEQGKVGFTGSAAAQRNDALFGEESQGLNNAAITQANANLNTLNNTMSTVSATSTTMAGNLSNSTGAILDVKAGAEQAGMVGMYFSDSLNNATGSASNLPPILLENAGGLVEIANGAGDATGALNDMSWGGIDPTAQAFSELSTKINEQIDLFNKFAKNTGVSGTEMLGNMKSQVEGVREWSQMLKELGQEGIEDGLLQELAKLGPQGYETVAAFKDMTHDQLMEANEIYKETLSLSDEAAGTIKEGFEALGKDIGDGTNNALEESVSETPKIFKTGIDDTLKEGENIAETKSPSKRTKRLGENIMDGLRLGMTGAKSTQVLSAIKQLGNKMFQEFNRIARESTQKFASTFSNNVSNMINAIRKGFQESSRVAETEVANMIRNVKTAADAAVINNNFESVGVSITNGIAKGISNTTAIQNICNAARNAVIAAKNAAAAEAEVNSPSKLFMREIGAPIAEGIAKGITDNTNMPETAAETLIKNILESMQLVDDILNGNIDFDPVITPRLDLTYLNHGIHSINSAFESKRLRTAMDGQVNGETDGSGSVTYNQYNYSPKSLSRLDMYRNTKNLLTGVRGFSNVQGAQYG